MSKDRKRNIAKIFTQAEGGSEQTPSRPSLYTITPITPKELLGSSFRECLGKKASMGRFSLADTPIQFVAMEHPELADPVRFTDYYAVVGRLISPMEYNRILHAVSRYQNYGLDSEDAFNDWQLGLHEPNYSDTRARRDRHAGIPGWNDLMTGLPFLHEFMGKSPDYTSNYPHPTDFTVPVMHWRVHELSGRKKWDFSPISGPLYEQIQADAKNNCQHTFANPNRVNPLIGIYAAAFLSPDVVNGWPEREGYEPGTVDPSTWYAKATNVMGTTQAVLQTLRHQDELFKSKFMQAAEIYIANEKAAKTPKKRR